MLKTQQIVGVVLAVLLGSGCAIRHAAFAYRLTGHDSRAILVPPGVGSPFPARRTINIDGVRGAGRCPRQAAPIAIRSSDTRIRVTLRRDALVEQPAGWLTDWAAGLEEQGCLKPGVSFAVAASLAEALPLDPSQAFRLLASPGGGDMLPQSRIQVVSPTLRSGSAGAPSSANLIAVETAWYAVRPRPGGPGLTLASLFAERSANRENERLAQPSFNPFQFAAEASFYRLVYKQDQTALTAWVVAARSRSELNRRTQALEAGATTCELLAPPWCTVMPQVTAINVFLPVTVNGREVLVQWGATVAAAIRMSGVERAESLFPQLAVERPFRGRLVPVRFDRASRAIFNLPLLGGEAISWK